jgi:hypothetical protein
VRHCAEEWDISERQAEHYIARARKLQQLDAELERPEWLAAAIARLQDYEREARKRATLASPSKLWKTKPSCFALK